MKKMTYTGAALSLFRRSNALLQRNKHLGEVHPSARITACDGRYLWLSIESERTDQAIDCDCLDVREINNEQLWKEISRRLSRTRSHAAEREYAETFAESARRCQVSFGDLSHAVNVLFTLNPAYL